MELPLLALITLIIVFGMIGDFYRRHRLARKLARSSVVEAGVKYPNNHHVLGVGYYHAAANKWFPHPWNEYREDRGYYWDGEWRRTPDQRMVPRSLPLPGETTRVNEEWRKADPELTGKFWAAVDRDGFGTAIRRSEGS